MAYSLTNGFQTTLNGSIDNSQTTLTLTSSTGAPTAPWIAAIIESGITTEILLIGALSGTAASSITRAFEPIADGTQSGVSHASGATITQVLTVAGLRDAGLSAPTIGARANRSSTFSVSTATWTPLQFNAEDFDTDAFHDNSTNPSRFTIPVGLSGKYLITAVTSWAANASGSRYVAFAKNGSRINQLQKAAENLSGEAWTITDTIDLVAGDYVEVHVYQDSGGSLNITIGASMAIHKLDSGRVGKSVGVSVYNSTTQNCTNNTWTAITFDTENWDTDGFHDTGSNTSRFTIPTGMGGKYFFRGQTTFGANSTNTRYLAFTKNGLTAGDPNIKGAMNNKGADAGFRMMQNMAIVDLVAGDYVELYALQDSGSTLTLGATTVYYSSALEMVRLDSNATGVLASNSVMRVGGSSYTTTSTTFTDVSTSDLALTITTGARRCIVGFSGGIGGSTTQFIEFDVDVDGTRLGDTTGGLYLTQSFSGGTNNSASFTAMTSVLSAGSHTFKLKWRTNTGTATMYAASSGGPAAHFWVQELPDSGALVAGNPPKAIGSTAQRVSRTAGDITFSSTITTMTELSSALRLSIAASSGDILQIGLSTIGNAGSTGEFAIDSATIVSSAIVHQVSAGTRGIGHGYGGTSAVSVGNTLTYAVVSGDISGGTVTVSPTYINSGTTGGKLYADSTYGLTYWVINLGH